MALKIDKKIVGYSVKGESCDDSINEEVEEFYEEIDCEDCDYKIKANLQQTDYGQNIKRPEVLPAAVYQIKDPIKDTNIYCSLSNMGGKPFEIFINSRHTESQQWVSAMTVLISAMFRAGVPADFIGKELQQIVDSNPYFYKGKSGCTVSHIGRVILEHCKDEENDLQVLIEKTESITSAAEPIPNKPKGDTCAKCGGTVIKLDGCPTCLDCGDSKCG